ncbi:FAD-dependent oxidoreductase [Propionimicrobium sp. PCR01-08-3]|uniref:NAD(P)/FAD-dependent oxidoreductase n=1 Tax=Propionimicrobium sp. PCR01-08-3 TaxID=3052086 RepID=UPI00255C92E5|nr:FAD-dependent oxidoreductase [Propionimicrobium sp. PCR01-08-3]WIY81537.1 FAD-dependent oxidoreductase [Propionimicrobium sp. PCR01-08-3]
MSEYDYLIIGGGEAANAAARGIREQDQNGSIGIISADTDGPYDRTALTKALWTDPDSTEQSILAGTDADTGATLLLNTTVKVIHRGSHEVSTSGGETIGYKKLLLAMGSVPTAISGSSDERIIAMRSLSDYRKIRELIADDKTAIVVGGGFIGTEIAASLASNDVDVTLIYPERVLGERSYPKVITDEIHQAYVDHGVRLVAGHLVDHAVIGSDGRPGVVLDDGSTYSAAVVIAGMSAKPALGLASEAGLDVDKGVLVDEHLRTSDPDIWAAGDIIEYRDAILGRTRIEHVDHARHSGATAGHSMAGSDEVYDYTPFFWSDIFDNGYEAIGRLDATLTTEVVDVDDGHVVYYLDDQSRPVGVLAWNVWDTMDRARQVLADAPTDREALRARIS